MVKSIFIVAFALVTACSQFEAMREYEATNEAANKTIPQNYKAEILSFMRTYLNDPTQVRDAVISDPVIKSVDGAERYVVCLRYNAKKTDGKYAGNKENIVTFRSGRFNRMIDAREPREAREIRERCKDIPMNPFVELQQLTR